MANPAPIIQKINAFDVTKGTTIKYNIIGGTELVRSSKLYLYDNETNDLIATHLDVSTTSTHTVPANNDSSWTYASGKSAANYVNEKKYYVTIQTFTNVSGTTGESGISNASLFWGLLNPTMEFDAVPTNIEQTSYNFSAIYNTSITTATEVTNQIQQYQFDLYDESNNKIATSGIIFGSGEPQTDTHEFKINYNFTGLENDVAYYATCTAVSTEGMEVTAVSGIFTVSISTVAFAKASVINNCTEGYITIISNITNIVGRTNVDTSDLGGKIDLTGDGWLIWDEGFTFPTVSVPNVGITSRWTMELWGTKFDSSALTDKESFVIHLQDTGDMYFYFREFQDNNEAGDVLNMIRVDMYVYPYGQDIDVSSYLQSNSIEKPVDGTELDIWTRCIDGWYELELHLAPTE